ncbi:MAG TPA: NfeD family protein [Candidatus Binatia bacterium]|jgi:membrane protein implicated in regulation of membrane protease activity|nr:NfeD family protein [Candidatus Binatia bacterium]
MTWADFYLICFVLGFILSCLALFGTMHIDIPHFHFHLGGAHHGHAGHGGAHANEVAHINIGTVAAFLAWFGGTGYLLARFSVFWGVLAFGASVVSGLAGATIVFYFLAKVLVRSDENLDPADYDMVGVLGTAASAIRPAGIGEIIFSQHGFRRASPARSEQGNEIAKGTEVVVTRYERGIAYVRPWEEFANEAQSTVSEKSGSNG